LLSSTSVLPDGAAADGAALPDGAAADGAAADGAALPDGAAADGAAADGAALPDGAAVDGAAADGAATAAVEDAVADADVAGADGVLDPPHAARVSAPAPSPAAISTCLRVGAVTDGSVFDTSAGEFDRSGDAVAVRPA